MSQKQPPFSIRPIKPPQDRKPKNLAEFIARVNATEPGGFRALDEASLKKEIEERKQKQDGGADTPDVQMEDGAGSEDEADSDAIKDVVTTRNEVLWNIAFACSQAEGLLGLVSLLMSKEAPTQVMGTLPQELRNKAGIGTLGSTKLHEPPFLEQRSRDNTLISTGGKLLMINNTADKLLAAASKLQKEITAETKYWQEVLAVKESGWSVSRSQTDPHMMAVKFGFSDSTADFQAHSWAVLGRADDGSVSLKMPRLAAEPKRLVVTMEKDGKMFGRSSLPQLLPDDAPLELRVREARNTILAQELWHEINREARSLLAYNVSLLPSSVSFKLDDSTTIFFTLATLGDLPELGDEAESRSGDAYAETICISLYLLLSYAHRQNARKRTQVRPLSKDEGRLSKPAYSLIRPVIAYLQQEARLRSCVQFISSLIAVLQSAGITSARYTVQELPFLAPASESASEQLLATMLRPHTFRIDSYLTPQVRLDMTVTTQVAQLPTALILIHPVPAARLLHEPPVENPLSAIFPPADRYDTLNEAFQYLSGATTRSLTKHFDVLVAEWMAKAPQGEKYPTAWIPTIKGDGIRDRDTERRGVFFELLGDRGGQRDPAKSVVGDGQLRTPSLPTVTGLKVVGDQLDTRGRVVRQVWTWTIDDIGKGTSEHKEGIEDVVRRVLMTSAQAAPTDS